MIIQRGYKMRKLAIVITLLIVFSATAECAITNKYGPYYGKVIDTDTKEPLEGASVLVVFYTEEYGPAGAITHYADAIETVTDKAGEFKFPAYRVTVVRPLHGWDKYGYLTIFKPGYGCYPHHKDVKPMFVPNGTLPEDKQIVIELPKLMTKEERIRNVDCFPLGIPNLKMQILIKLNNMESKILGLQPTHIRIQENEKGKEIGDGDELVDLLIERL
jgi:hypothetical protein